MAIRRWWALGGLFLTACGSQHADGARGVDGAHDADGTHEDPGGGSDESDLPAPDLQAPAGPLGGPALENHAIDAEGFELAPAVPFPGTAATPFGGGHLLCRERRAEITPDIANIIGYDVEADRAALEATQVVAVRASHREVRSTLVHQRGRIVRILRVDRTPPLPGFPVEEAVPVGCPNGVEYELLQQLYTEDGSVRGAFLIQVPATKLGEPTARHLYADVDLRNFEGELPVAAVNDAEPAFTTARLTWTVGDVEVPQFEFAPIIWAEPVYDVCEQPFCRLDGDLNITASFGVSTAIEVGDFDEVLNDYGDILIPSTLTEIKTRQFTHRPHVRIWVTANGAGSAAPSSTSRVRVTALAGGQSIAAGTLDLAPDAERLAGGVVSGFIDVGPLPEGIPFSLDVFDEFGLGGVRSHVVVNDCDIPHGTASCDEPGCRVQSALPILAAGCTGRASYPLR